MNCCRAAVFKKFKGFTCSFLAFLRSNPFPIASAPPAPPRPPPALRPPHPLPLTFGRLPPERARETPRALLLLSTNGDLAPGAAPQQQSPPPNNLLARRCCCSCCSCIIPAVGPVAAAAAHDDVDPAAAAEERPLDLHLRPPSRAADGDDVAAALEIPADRPAVVAAGRRAAESGSRQQQEKA